MANNNDKFETVILRPGGILAGNGAFANLSKDLFIGLPDLAAALVQSCICRPNKGILENGETKDMVASGAL